MYVKGSKAKYPEKLSLYIGKRDIAKGKVADAECCPIANAMKRKFPDSSIIAVYYEVDIISNKNETASYKMCKIGIKLQEDFDHKLAVKPTHIILYRKR